MSGYSKSFKHAWDFWYKWCPAGSASIGDQWPTASISASYDGNDQGIGLTNGFYNMGGTSNMNVKGIAHTRHPAVISPDLVESTVAVTGTTPDETALPWGSSAIDYLWNVLNISASLSTVVTATNGTTNCETKVSFTYNNKSFNYHNWGANPTASFFEQTSGLFAGRVKKNGYGVEEYPVTSSWTVYESKLNAGENLSYNLRKVITTGDTDSFFPATLTITGSGYEKPSARVNSIPSYADLPMYESRTDAVQSAVPLPAGYNPTNLTYGDTSTGSFDGRYFDLTGGCGITRDAVSESLVTYQENATDNTTSGLQAKTTALKNRRLFFPTVATSSEGPAFGFPPRATNAGFADWVALSNGGFGSDIYFDENGGIYNVKFNLKRDLDNDYYPDSGNGSELLVYVFDVNATVPVSSQLERGKPGWLPPDNNIIRISNEPEMSFANPATGYFLETFNINVVQYGFPAQLVFEATGSLSSEKYFGCVIDDVEFCKVGVSTDPDLIKPETTGEAITDKEITAR